MKCPKCGYLGFETVDRCRNCGYDFSLTSHSQPPAELPLHSREGAGAPLADFDLALPEPAQHGSSSMDLDRLIGTGDSDPEAAPANSRAAGRDAARTGGGLPLFSPSADDVDDMPLITAPRPVRPPLSVRRATPDVPRVRPRAMRPRVEDTELNFQVDSASSEDDVTAPPGTAMPTPLAASRVARLAAMLVDLLLLGSIDAVVIYLTLAIAGLTLANIAILPIVPTATFLLLLNGGYLVAFTAAGGQTIGKMLTGIRVMGDDGTRVDVGRAVLRAGGCFLSVLTAGLGYVPAFFTPDARALQDRVAGTRVVRAL